MKLNIIMYKHSQLLVIVLLSFWAFSGNAQEKRNYSQILNSYADSLLIYKARIDSVSRENDSLRSAQSYYVSNKYFRYFAPLAFYPDITGSILRLDADSKTIPTDRGLMSIYINHPEYVQYSASNFNSLASKQQEVRPVKPANMELTKQVEHSSVKKKETEEITAEHIDMYVTKPHFWSFNGDYYLQFLQNYVSPNWYKSGSNSYSMLGTVTLQYNYNNKQRVKWENKLEMRLGFQTTDADTVNNFKTSDDLIRYTSKLGLQAFSKWYYTLQVIAQTQFARGLKNNNDYVYSDFMSPFNLNVSAGMDYSVQTKNKKLTGSIHIAPLAFNFKYVDRKYLAQSFGINKGHRTLEDFGSQYTIDLTWKPVNNFKWKTRLYGYTTYHKYEMEWENTFTLQFNKYISTCVYLYPRFDDSAMRIDDNGYFQFKEYFSFGFSYSM